MKTTEARDVVLSLLQEASLDAHFTEERAFPGERWLVFHAAADAVAAAQSLAGELEDRLNSAADPDSSHFVVIFRAKRQDQPPAEATRSPARLSAPSVDQLIQLLEARSRTSDALPSLRYMEDPRASLASVAASRHQFIYGRRGVGKTALLVEAKRLAEKSGVVCIWLNAHVIRELPAHSAAAVVARMILEAIAREGGSSASSFFKDLESLSTRLAALGPDASGEDLNRVIPDINGLLRRVLSGEFVRLFVYIDDFYLIGTGFQAQFLDYLAGMTRDCDAWMKIASIERLTRPWEPSTRKGLELPHDASAIDLDVTLEDPGAAQEFLQEVLASYITTAGIGSVRKIFKPEALGRLVLASGGVPRDYLNLVANSIVVARESRALAREVGREDVAVAAGRSAQSKKKDLEQDVTGGNASRILVALDRLSRLVKGDGYAYFRVDVSEKDTDEYELFALLVDLRFAHLVQASLSDQHKPGVRYEAYVLDLSEFADIRLKRGLNLLDLESGVWTHRLTGQKASSVTLSYEQLRERLRRSPVVPMSSLA